MPWAPLYWLDKSRHKFLANGSTAFLWKLCCNWLKRPVAAEAICWDLDAWINYWIELDEWSVSAFYCFCKTPPWKFFYTAAANALAPPSCRMWWSRYSMKWASRVPPHSTTSTSTGSSTTTRTWSNSVNNSWRNMNGCPTRTCGLPRRSRWPSKRLKCSAKHDWLHTYSIWPDFAMSDLEAVVSYLKLQWFSARLQYLHC